MQKFVLILLLATWANGIAQDRKIVVQILDSESRKPVRGAQIKFNSNKSTFTNHLGYAELEGLEKTDLVVFSIGYETSTVQASSGNLKFFLNKRFVMLSALNLSFDERLKDYVNLNELNVKTDYGQSADYDRGWSEFYNELAESLKNDTALQSVSFPIEVRFTVNRDGEIVEIKTKPESNVDTIQKAFNSLKRFKPAVQADFPVEQFFVFLLMRSVEATPVPAVEIELTAEPVGGLSAFYGYIARNLNYPKQARKERIEGRVMIRFIVDSDGSIKDTSVIKGIGGGCDEEAVRVVSSSPKWKPGTRRGVPVSQEVRVPIQFRL